MNTKNQFKERYKTKNTPWDIGKPDFNLIDIVTQTPVKECRALDIGCGTGDNSIWLAQKGFDATGIDSTDIALEQAKEKAFKANVTCRFFNIDFMSQKVEGAPFGFAFDRGCFHTLSSEDDRKTFAQKVAAYLDDSGLWLSIIGNADEKRKFPGPPQRSARDIILAVEPCFEILYLSTTYFGSNSPTPPRAWRCLMRKRIEIKEK